MKKTFILILTVLSVLLFFTACEKKQEADKIVATETYSQIEGTTINNIPNNTFPDEMLIFKAENLVLIDTSDYETEFDRDGYKTDIYKSENGDFIENVNYDENGNIIDYSKTVYDSKGRIDCIYVFKTDKSFNYACKRVYDSLGRFYRYYYYDSDCRLICYQVVSYDAYGNELSVELFDTKGNSLQDFPDVFD